ncbi:MAG TPA: 3-hydroxyacyl-CoA dehydrogenase/enoyl-CoA hydratase family protein [Acidobacteria bacterium]|nr:3-hydroxyacyl-CoA dehydrogenase/enoyl-CoA hydratase family protein [Acidobacteriota bacterium]
MKVAVIGSGSIGPDLAYGFVSALAASGDHQVYLHDIRQEALDAGVERIRGYVKKGLSRGKLSPRVAAAIEKALVPTLDIGDLAECDYVLEAATEELGTKQAILDSLEAAVGPECLVGFATSGIPRARIVANARHPERCFVNHPFFPAWRSLPMEVVLSGDATFEQRMLEMLRRLGKVPVVTADVPCFAADDIFCNYCAEAARIVVEGVATPAQVDKIVNDAIGGGGPFLVMDLTRGNLLNVKCLKLMQEGPPGGEWFAPPEIFTTQGNRPWHDRKNPGDPSHDEALARTVLDRILAVLLARTFYVADNEICSRRELNWMTRTALGFAKGLLDLAEDLGPEKVAEICESYAAAHPGFEVPPSIRERSFPAFRRNVEVTRRGDVAVVSIERPEVKNALNHQTMEELDAVFAELERDAGVRGVVLTSFDGSLAGADIMELAALKTPEEAAAKCRHGHGVLARIAAMSKPVVAAVDGPVLGGGSELSMACHGRVVGPSLVLGQPEVNLGIIPGYGGTQRLPRLVGLERGVEMLRSARSIGADKARAWGWAAEAEGATPVDAAMALIHDHLEGKVKLAPVDPAPMEVPAELPAVEIGHRSLAIDAILCDVIRRGLARPLDEGLEIEAEGFARCKKTVDYDIGMTNFIQNGPRVPATFLHE